MNSVNFTEYISSLIFELHESRDFFRIHQFINIWITWIVWILQNTAVLWFWIHLAWSKYRWKIPLTLFTTRQWNNPEKCRYSLRNAKSVQFPQRSSSVLLSSFIPSAVALWNSLLVPLTSASSFVAFVKYIDERLAADQFSFGISS